MEDDFDDLLNEVESKYCNSRKTVSLTNNISTQRSLRPNMQILKTPAQVTSDLNEMIDDILTEPDNEKTQQSLNRNVSDKVLVKIQQKRCFAVYIGGSKSEPGLATAVQSKSCDQLRCTDCDFKVVSFDDCHWHSSVDYLFLRNNVPEYGRLKAKLVHRKGCRAYACQCKWRSLAGAELCDLKTEPDLKWVCGKH